jgi:outer membrane receptor protein involved in Fe transport
MATPGRSVARGFQASATNKMVVMIDGRSIYTPLFSGVFWDVQDVLLADVDRIEVIRSAGGTLWGANAVNGVINIITKLAKDTQGGLVQIGGGNAQSIVGARYGTKLGDDGHIRAYAKFRQFDPLPYVVSTTPSDDKLRGTQAGFRFDRGTTSALSFTVQGDVYAQNLGLATPDDDASGATSWRGCAGPTDPERSCSGRRTSTPRSGASPPNTPSVATRRGRAAVPVLRRPAARHRLRRSARS